MKQLIYLDNAATTKTRPEVVEAMLPYFTEYYGNPSSVYEFSAEPKRAIAQARETIAKALGAKSNEIYFTYGGTESDNWALISTAEAYQAKGKHIITTKIEHHAILHTCEYLEQRGFEVTYLDVDEFGVVTCHKKGRATIIAITGNGYTAKCKVKVTGKAKKKGVMYGIANVDGLFIRNSASLQGLQLGQYNCGVSVTIVDTIGEWYKIKYNGGYAYVRSAYVTITSDQRSGKVVNASNGKISTETWVYTGVGYGANTVAPVGTRVLVTGASGDYYQVRYGTGSLGNGYVPKSCVTLDKGFRYGVSTKKYKIGEKVSSTPQVTLFRTAKTKKRAYIYNNATSSAKRIGRLMKNTRVVLNSQKINGYYQLIFTNGRIGYVKRSQLKLLKTKVKTNKNTANTYVKAYR